ncbi:MAG: hypothetical protein LBP64_01360 [Tannerella sp.]|jgi:hypothetical protein|nr:hypothetical protein [Tannerella sp.]
MSSPLYISPFTLMNRDSDNIPSREDILSAKRQRLSELEASGDIVIKIRDRAYSKDDLVKAFDHMLSDYVSMHFHSHVRKDRALLLFLETGVYQPKPGFLLQPVYDDEAFRRWLSPYYAAALRRAMDMQDAGSIARLLGERLRPDGEYEAEQWEPVRKQLVKASSYLDSCIESFNYIIQKKSIWQSGSASFLQLLTLKPPYLFFNETSEYTRLLHNVACRMPPFEGQVIYHNLSNLDLYPELKERCKENHYKNMHGKMNRSKKIAVFLGEKLLSVKYRGFPGKWLAGDAMPEGFNITVRIIAVVAKIIEYILFYIIALIVFVIVAVAYGSMKSLLVDNSPEHVFPEFKMDTSAVRSPLRSDDILLRAGERMMISSDTIQNTTER